jgi:hypothetical protein
MKNIYPVTLLLLILAIALASCADKTIEDTNPERPTYKPSPTEVVERFLKALKDENFKKAFEYVYVPSTDEAGYVIQMTNVYKQNQITINSFHILATQIFELSSTVVVEIDQSLKSPVTGQIIHLKQKSKYSLGLYDKKWKVTSGDCYENCLEEVPEIQIAD